MCVSCGCDKPYENHGDPRNITMDQLERASQASGKTPRDVAANIQKSVSQHG